MTPLRDAGLLVVLEGVEGAGKTTQVELLRQRLERWGVPHTVSREPGGTRLGEGIRELLLERRELDVPAESELLLVLAARVAFVREVVRPALERGEVVLADRFELSTLAYQGFGRGLDLDAIRTMNRFATEGLRPNLTILLDVPARSGLERVEGAGKGKDRIEAAADGFLERVRDGYRRLAREEDGVVVVDGNPPSEEVHRRIVGLLGGRFPGQLPETFVRGAG